MKFVTGMVVLISARHLFQGLKIPLCKRIEGFVGCSGDDSNLVTADCVH